MNNELLMIHSCFDVPQTNIQAKKYGLHFKKVIIILEFSYR